MENAGLKNENTKMDQDLKGDNESLPTRVSAAVAGQDDDKKLFVGGLNREKTTEDRLREYFGKFGAIESITVKTDPQTRQSRGFAFVVFEKPETADKLIGLDHWIDSRKVDVKKVSKEFQRGKLFVGGLTPELSDDDIKEYFSKFGAIADIQSPVDKAKNQRKGFCFITFESKEVVNKLLKNPKVCINGKWVDLRKAVSNPENIGGGGSLQSEKIFVGGLTPDITDVDIKEHFSQFGNVVEVQSPYDKAKNQRKAFCFITFDSKDAVFELLKEPKQVINGKPVDLRIAVTNPEATWGPNGRHSGGKVFVGGLTPDITDAEIRKFFSQHGPVIDVQSPYDKVRGQRKGFCFVSFASKESVRRLLSNPVRYINGKKIDLRNADPEDAMEVEEEVDERWYHTSEMPEDSEEFPSMYFRPRDRLPGSLARYPVPLPAQPARNTRELGQLPQPRMSMSVPRMSMSVPRMSMSIPRMSMSIPRGPLSSLSAARQPVPRIPAPKPQRDSRPFFRYSPY